MRSSSVQGLIPGHRHWHSTGKQQNLSERQSSGGDDRRNYGELLYERGMRRKEEKRNLVQRARSE